MGLGQRKSRNLPANALRMRIRSQRAPGRPLNPLEPPRNASLPRPEVTPDGGQPTGGPTAAAGWSFGADSFADGFRGWRRAQKAFPPPAPPLPPRPPGRASTPLSKRERAQHSHRNFSHFLFRAGAHFPSWLGFYEGVLEPLRRIVIFSTAPGGPGFWRNRVFPSSFLFLLPA